MFLSSEQLDQLVDSVDPDYRCLVLTAAGTGIRGGELAGLGREHLDLLRRRLHGEAFGLGGEHHPLPLRGRVAREVAEDLAVDADGYCVPVIAVAGSGRSTISNSPSPYRRCSWRIVSSWRTLRRSRC